MGTNKPTKDKKILLIYVFSLLGGASLFVFGLWNVVINQHIAGALELCASLLVVLNVAFLKYTKKVIVASNVVLAILFVILIFLYISGGIGGVSGVFWYFTMPVVSIFLLGRKTGVLWVVGLLFVTTLIFFFYPSFDSYTWIDTRQLVFSVIVVSLLVTFYSDINEEIESKLSDKQKELLTSFSEMKNEEKEIALQKEQLESNNKELERTKLAMLNLLEDSKILEGRLRRERDKASAIISSMGEGLLVIDLDYKINLINKAACELLDMMEDEAIGKNWADIVKAYHKDIQASAGNRSFYKAINQKKIFVTSVSDNHYYETLKGRKFPVASITGPLYSEGKILGAIKVFRDVSMEKRDKESIEKIVKERTQELNDKNKALESAQEQITQGWLRVREEQARLTSSINALPLGFFIVDSSHNILTINERAQEILGNKTRLYKLEDVGALFDIKELDFKNACNHCRGDIKPYEDAEIIFRNRYLRLFSVPVVSDERLLGTAILLEDITERKILERSKDEFLSIASHELRTPLTAIRGNTSMIMEYFIAEFKDESAKEMIKDIYESSVRLIGVVNDFLDVSRLEQKRLDFKNEKVNMLDLAKDVVEELKANLATGVTLDVVNVETLLPEVLADKNKTKEVLINLVGNAIKFTFSGRIEISFQKRDHILETLVSDTGRGISATNQTLLFRKFQQAGDSFITRDTTKGTGLGLYISKLLVEGMNGKIRLIKSEVGKGTVFGFALPISG